MLSSIFLRLPAVASLKSQHRQTLTDAHRRYDYVVFRRSKIVACRIPRMCLGLGAREGHFVHSMEDRAPLRAARTHHRWWPHSLLLSLLLLLEQPVAHPPGRSVNISQGFTTASELRGLCGSSPALV